MSLKKIVTLTLITLITMLTISSCKKSKINEMQTNELSEGNSNKLLRHIVLFKFKDSTSQENIKLIENEFLNLKSKIPEIHDFEWGLNNSPENLNKDFTHCFMLSFKSEDDRSIYLPHPDHKLFVDLIGPHIEDVLVFDYWN